MINAKKYAELIGKTPSAITMKLKQMETPALPGCVSVQKLGYGWVIVLRKDFDAAKAAEKFKLVKW